MINVLSYGGGINSSALFFYLTERNIPLNVVIFADTGEELPTTYDAVHRMSNECEKRNIPFITVKSRLGNLYDYYKGKHIVPSVMKRDCTGKFKVAPIRRYLRQVFGKQEKFVMYIGITIEEWSRMRESNVQYITNSYPFCDAKLTRQDNISILRKHNFPAQKSGCIGCIYNKYSTWLKIAIEWPEEFARWELLDKENSRYPIITLSPSFKLEDVRKAAHGQSQMTDFVESEPSCKNINGGCFL